MRTVPSFTELTNDLSKPPARFALSLRYVPALMCLGYVALIAIAGIVAQAGVFAFYEADFLATAEAVALIFGTSVLLIPALQIGGLNAPDDVVYGGLHVQKLLLSVVGAGILIASMVAAMGVTRPVLWPGLVLFFGAVAFVLVVGRLAIRSGLRAALVSGLVRGPRIALISSCRLGDEEMVHEFDRLGYSVVRELKLRREATPEEIDEIAVQAMKAARGSAIEEVLIAVDCVSVRLARPLLERLRQTPLPVRLVLNSKTTELFSHNPQRVGGMSTFEIQRPPLSAAELMSKRVLDTAVAAACLAVLSPLLLLVCAAIKLDTPGPVFFRQTRTGFNGRSFSILKFRSMTVMENGDTIVQAQKHDKRVTRTGRFLRRTSIDELPQLLNVLRGDMSIVGPRPHADAHDRYYAEALGNYAFRQHVAPGITGWAQIHGFRGETATVDDMRDRLKHDIWYIDHWSFWLDVQILVRTPFELLRARNAY